MNKNIILIVLVAFLIGAGGAAYYFYKQVNALKQDPNMFAKQEAAAIVAKVGMLIVLPEGEEPTVATITDPEKLKDQAFFINAKTGYKVLLYTNAKKAYLYDPANNRLVDVAPLSIGPSASSTPSAK
jgi:hypothetical protein